MIKVVSWNIAGGHQIASADRFDYKKEDLGYFTGQIKLLNPDIVCLQESHTSLDGRKAIAEMLSKGLGMDFVFNSPASPSHIDSGYKLGTAILSKQSFIKTQMYWYPDPEMELFFSDGRKAVTHKKNLQVVQFENFKVANHQLLPISIFGYKYDDGKEGSVLAGKIDQVMKNLGTPLIWCGDFNFDSPSSVYKTVQKLGLNNALPDKNTRPTRDGVKKTPDHIYYSKEFRLITSDVIETNTDHYLCFAEFEFAA